MANLNDVQERMAAFHRALTEFQDVLASTHAALTDRHDAIAGEWTDAAARDYHQVYDPLNQELERYLTQTGPSYLEVLSRKLAILDNYLNGHR